MVVENSARRERDRERESHLVGMKQNCLEIHRKAGRELERARRWKKG